MIYITWKKITAEGIIPEKKHPLDAGYDLYSPVDKTIPPKSVDFIDTSIAAQIRMDTDIQMNFYPSAKIEGCSGNAKKKGVGILGGRWDAPYQGSIGVVICNNLNTPLEIKKGDKIAQIVFQLIPLNTVEKILDENSNFGYTTDRGEDGFGSTGGIK
jgi:dUTP pyrophosphatase